jgi:hypothetical protein
MGRKNRGYKKTGLFRDAPFFVIATEGQKREPAYFEELVRGNTNVRVRVLKPGKDQRSSPLAVLRRARDYADSIGLQAQDQMWLVVDTDRWVPSTLHRMAKYCQRKGWGLAISNPCFEVWLYLHQSRLPEGANYTSQEMKGALAATVVGGYKAEVFIKLLATAIENARETDESEHYQLPGEMISQVWRLGEALVPFLGSE